METRGVARAVPPACAPVAPSRDLFLLSKGVWRVWEPWRGCRTPALGGPVPPLLLCHLASPPCLKTNI